MLAYSDGAASGACRDDANLEDIRLLVLTSLKADVEIRRFAEAVRRCNRDLFLGCQSLAF